ncbi:hypothetical protein [Salicibibacter halophilus]|nr:hypothetical protein [Salicibibacter halophilus]
MPDFTAKVTEYHRKVPEFQATPGDRADVGKLPSVCFRCSLGF